MKNKNFCFQIMNHKMKNKILKINNKKLLRVKKNKKLKQNNKSKQMKKIRII